MELLHFSETQGQIKIPEMASKKEGDERENELHGLADAAELELLVRRAVGIVDVTAAAGREGARARRVSRE